MRPGPILAGLTLTLAVGTHAARLDAVLAAEADGRFLEAAELGAALDTAAGHARAAYALAVYGFHIAPEEDREALFSRAMAHGERAVELDPDHADAQLQFAHAAGRHAESLGAMKAMRGGYAGKMRDAMVRAVELDPGMAQAHLSLGAWHANVVDQAGGLVARAMFGATRKKALEHLERALALAPDDKVVNFEVGRCLLLLAPKKNAGRARALLARAVEAPAQDAFGRIVHDLAAERLAALDAG